jgi:3-dehydroquinate dehydratase-2
MTASRDILVINGPNLNMLGKREESIYGPQTLADIESRCCQHAENHDYGCVTFQSNDEAEIITRIHDAVTAPPAGIIINAGAFTHTSVAIRDALAMVSCPVVEAHISNIHAREEFRHHSYLAGVATGVIAGFGVSSYILAIDAIVATILKE